MTPERPSLLAGIAALVDPNGVGTQAFQTWMRQITQAVAGYVDGTTTPVDASPVAATASPMTYVATSAGGLYLSGGTVSSVQLIRGADTLALAYATAGQLIPLSAGDSVKIAYTAAPTLRFVPR